MAQSSSGNLTGRSIQSAAQPYLGGYQQHLSTFVRATYSYITGIGTVAGGLSQPIVLGYYNIVVDDGTRLDSIPTTFVSYCVDLDHYYTGGSQNTTLGSMSGWMIGSLPTVGNPDAGKAAAYLYNTNNASATTNLQRAALQLAIWEALYWDGTGMRWDDFDTNFASVNSDVHIQALTYLDIHDESGRR